MSPYYVPGKPLNALNGQKRVYIIVGALYAYASVEFRVIFINSTVFLEEFVGNFGSIFRLARRLDLSRVSFVHCDNA